MTPSKQSALLRAQAAQWAAAQARRENLRVPKPFEGAPEFLAACRAMARMKGITPLDYAIQILDRKLPLMSEMQ